MIGDTYANCIWSAAAQEMNDHCEHCDGAGEIETDNNGPIVPCPVCTLTEEVS